MAEIDAPPLLAVEGVEPPDMQAVGGQKVARLRLQRGLARHSARQPVGGVHENGFEHRHGRARISYRNADVKAGTANFLLTAGPRAGLDRAADS